MDEQYVKACDCQNAPASGPRQVVTSLTEDPKYTRGENCQSDGRFIATAEHVRLACDKCNTPWRETANTDTTEAARCEDCGAADMPAPNCPTPKSCAAIALTTSFTPEQPAQSRCEECGKPTDGSDHDPGCLLERIADVLDEYRSADGGSSRRGDFKWAAIVLRVAREATPEQPTTTEAATPAIEASTHAESCPACDDDGGFCTLCRTYPSTPEQPATLSAERWHELLEYVARLCAIGQSNAVFMTADVRDLLAHIVSLQHQLQAGNRETEE